MKCLLIIVIIVLAIDVPAGAAVYIIRMMSMNSCALEHIHVQSNKPYSNLRPRLCCCMKVPVFTDFNSLKHILMHLMRAMTLFAQNSTGMVAMT